MTQMTMVNEHHVRSKEPALVRRIGRIAFTEGLIERGDRILVSVSGGADSVCLLSILSTLAARYCLTLQVAHFNHGLRGAEANEDERFVATLCQRLGVPYHSERLDLSTARREGRSLQELAREQRYAALLRLAKALGSTKVALGHTLDDQAETVLMWTLRGAGSSGLAGIPARRPPFIRPLLRLRRADILAYLRERRLSFRTDSSNARRMYFRNRIRHELLPMLEELRPGATRVLVRQADILREEDRCLSDWTSRELPRLSAQATNDESQLDRDQLIALPIAIQRRIVRHIISKVGGLKNAPPFGSVAAVLNQVVHGQSGATVTAQGVMVIREYGLVRFRRRCQPVRHEDVRIKVSVPSGIEWPLTGQQVVLRIMERQADPDMCHGQAGSGISAAMLDADRFTMDLTLRSWKAGDTFQPFGMRGNRKKLQDFFVDLKVPRYSRVRTPILVAPEGILWVAGYRIDHRFRVTSATRRILSAQLTPRTEKVE
jgi:tRNA(Ile)-lysidine synthase